MDFLGNALNCELEEARMLLDAAERAKRSIEAEVVDTRSVEHLGIEFSPS